MERASRTKEFMELLVNYSQTLKERGCPDDVLLLFGYNMPYVLAAAMEIWYKKYNFEPLKVLQEKGIYLAMPVIHRDYLPLPQIVVMMRGYMSSDINPAKFTDQILVPGRPYFMIDVEDGRSVLGRTQVDALRLISSQARSPFVTEDILALVIHTNVLAHHCVDAVGSCYGDDGCRMPTLVRDESGTPRLDFDSGCDACTQWGAPSCAYRL